MGALLDTMTAPVVARGAASVALTMQRLSDESQQVHFQSSSWPALTSSARASRSTTVIVGLRKPRSMSLT